MRVIGLSFVSGGRGGSHVAMAAFAPMRRPRALWFAVVLAASAGCEWMLGDEGRRLAADAAAPCPPDMVEVTPAQGAALCVDAYEASHDSDDATRPASVAGATPWTDVDHPTAAAACAAVGKRLCQADEVIAACAGPAPGTRYPYGNAYEPNYAGPVEEGDAPKSNDDEKKPSSDDEKKPSSDDDKKPEKKPKPASDDIPDKPEKPEKPEKVEKPTPPPPPPPPPPEVKKPPKPEKPPTKRKEWWEELD